MADHSAGREVSPRGVDGKELFYLALDGKLIAIPIKTDPVFEIGQPTTLFATTLTLEQPIPSHRRYAVTANGQRFLVASAPQTDASNSNSVPITAVVNWTAALHKK
jgi:hypothetical protein